jgi:hypothetical protein
MRHLPVIDNRSLIGIISISDIAEQRAPTRCDAPFNRNGSWPIRNVGMIVSTECNERINLRAMVRSITL